MEEAAVSQENLERMLDNQHDVEPDSQVQSETPVQNEEDPDDWKTPKFRSKVKERIQEEIMRTASQVPKSGTYLEDYVFSKAKSKKEYLDLVAGVVIYVAKFNSRLSKAEEKAVAESEKESAAVVTDS